MRIKKLVVIGLLNFLFAGVLIAQDSIKDFSWFGGCRTQKNEKSLREECWTRPLGNSMQGSGREIRNDKTVSREFMTIEFDSDGKIVMYIQLVGDSMKALQPPVAFTFSKISGREFKFENPKHDYPQKIVYQKQDDNSIIVTISLMDNTRRMKFQFK